MRGSDNLNQGGRRFPAGLLACLLMTAGVLVIASPGRQTEPAAVQWDLADDRILADGLPPSAAGARLDASGAVAVPDAVRTHLSRLAASGDPRHLRYGWAALSGAPAAGADAVELAVLEARLLQSEHRFDAAASRLRDAVAARPGNAEAWLLLSDVLRRGGHVDEARRACLRVALAGAPVLGHWCAVQALQSVGNYDRAMAASDRLLPGVDRLPAPSRRWALEVAADAAIGARDPVRAVDLYRRAHAIGEPPFALRLAFADALIDSGRHAEVFAILRDDVKNVSALVRIAIASRAIGEPLPPADLAYLDSVMAADGRDGTDVLRLRDAAVWALRYRGDPLKALDLALRNWAAQKGAEDARLLRTAAIAAGDREAQILLHEWQQQRAAEATS